MNLLIRLAALALVAGTAAPAAAQSGTTLPPTPLPLGVPYAYQVGNPYWFQPLVAYPSYYPFAATGPLFGRYSWDYGAYYPAWYGWYLAYVPVYLPAYTYWPYPAAYPYLPYPATSYSWSYPATSYTPYAYSSYYPTLPPGSRPAYGW